MILFVFSFITGACTGVAAWAMQMMNERAEEQQAQYAAYCAAQQQGGENAAEPVQR